MKFQIIEDKLLSGRAAKIYTIKENGDDLTYLDHFIEDNIEKYSQEVGTILSKLKVMGHSTGCESNDMVEMVWHVSKLDASDCIACILEKLSLSVAQVVGKIPPLELIKRMMH